MSGPSTIALLGFSNQSQVSALVLNRHFLLHKKNVYRLFSHKSSSGSDDPVTRMNDSTKSHTGATDETKIRGSYGQLLTKKTPDAVRTDMNQNRSDGNRWRRPMNDKRGDGKPPPTPPQRIQGTNSGDSVVSSRPHKSHWDRKPNFAKTVLDPAAQGHLQKGHESGIPKLAARKHKSLTVKDAFPERRDRVEALAMTQQLLQSADTASTDNTQAQTRILPRVDDIISGRTSLKSVVELYTKQRSTPAIELDTVKVGKVMSREHLISLFQHPTVKSLNSHASNEILPSGPKRSTNFLALHRKISENTIKSGFDIWGDSITKVQKDALIREQQDIQQQLTKSNDTTDNTSKEYAFWPTEYKMYTLDLTPTDSRRQPKPVAFPTNRSSPPSQFVLGHNYEAFLFVQRIPHPVFQEDDIDKKAIKVLGRFDQPTHRQAVSEFVASKMGVDISQVYPTSMTSAFIGFDSPEQAANVVLGYRSRQESSNPMHIQLQVRLLNPKESKESLSNTPDDTTILTISNIPAGMKAGSLLRHLHGLESSTLPMMNDPIQIVDPTTAWIRLAHPIPQSSLVKIENHLKDKMIPYQALLLQPAQRSVIHSGYTGPARHYPIRRLGPNLIVHGDTPSIDFFRSHAMVLHLCDVSEQITALDISKYFQKYCFEPRDVIGSTEFIYDLEGHFTGRVYVGFDFQEEGMAAWKNVEAAGQRIQISVGGADSDVLGDGSWIRVRPVRDQDVKRGPKLGPRTYRSEEELWQSLMDWEKYVDQKDIEYLESMGVGKHVLEEAFMATRHNNPTFGVEDWARQGEKLRNEKKPGQHFKQFVKLYIETLKEVATSREKPGMLFEGMFVPGEEIDLSIFDREEARLQKLKLKYES